MRGIVRCSGQNGTSLRSAVEHHLVHQRRSLAHLLLLHLVITGTIAVASHDHRDVDAR